jgi:hypothetical protein
MVKGKHRVLWVMVGLLSGLAGCDRLAPYGRPAGDASRPTPDGPRGDARNDGSVDHSAGDGANDAAAVCSPGTVVKPVAAFNASPLTPADACDVDNALELDGEVAGLDRSVGGEDDCAEWASEYTVCGCVGVDFGAPLDLVEVTIWAAYAERACTRRCSFGQCDTGHTTSVFGGTSMGPYQLLGELPLTSSTPARHSLELEAPVRYVVVCREAYSADRDDVVVDAVEGTCR